MGKKFHIKGESESKTLTYQTKDHVGNKRTGRKETKRYKTFEVDNTGNITAVGWTDWDKKIVSTGTGTFQKVEANAGYAGDFTINFSTRGDAEAEFMDETSNEWGAANITKEMFIDEQGQQRPIEDIYAKLDPLLPGITGDKLKLQIKDMLPKYAGQEEMEEEKGFAREGFQKDVYGISKDAGKAGAQMQQAYGSGMGSQMRGAYGAQKDVAQQFKQAEQGYEQDIYGIEKKAGAEFEAGVEDWMQGSWFEDPNKEGDYEQGGRVPNKRQTFSEVLSKIPDAGGS